MQIRLVDTLCKDLFVSMTLVVVLWPIASLPATEPSFQSDIRPIVQARCVKCHGADDNSGNVNFAAIADDKMAARQRKLWRKAVAQLEAGAMLRSTGAILSLPFFESLFPARVASAVAGDWVEWR